MQITQVSAHYLRLPEVTDRCDGTQDTCLIQIDTDAGMGDPIRIIEGRYRP